MSKATTSRRQALKAASGLLAGAALPARARGDAGAAAGSGPAILAPEHPWTSPNPFLSAAFAPVFDERDDVGLVVEGEIPAGLRGVFMRNGPNPEFEPDAHYAYPFDGTGMIHAIFLEDGRARYRNRWVLTDELQKERAAGRRLYNTTFSPPPHANLANTNVVRHAGRHLALYEGGLPYEIDGGLATRGPIDFDGKLRQVMSAHPKIDPVTGDMLSVQYDLDTGALHYTRVDRTGSMVSVVPFAAPWAAMVHDIAITEHHVLAFVAPLVFDLAGGGPPANWEPERGTMVALIARNATTAADVRWLKGPPFFNWHTVNAFEADGRIEVAMPWYDRFSLKPEPHRLELHRIVIDTGTGTVTDETIDDQVCEFGRVNDAYVGRRARYGYVGLRAPRAGEPPQPGAFEAFARYDLVSGAKVVHQFGPGATVCEPVFVADPRGAREDDGFILSFVHQAGEAGGLFSILDARNLDAEPVATVRLPRRVPAGLHGSWMPA